MVYEAIVQSKSLKRICERGSRYSAAFIPRQPTPMPSSHTAAATMIEAFHRTRVEDEQQVEMWLEETGDCAVALEAMRSEGAHHRGHARIAMERLVGLADVHRVLLTLVPRPLDPKNDDPRAPHPDRNAPDAEALEAFYERLGFERSGGEFKGSPVLVRSPR